MTICPEKNSHLVGTRGVL